MIKNKTKIRKVIKGRVEKTKKKLKSFYTAIRSGSRFPILAEGFKSKSIPMNKEIDLGKLRIKGKLFSDLSSSKPYIGRDTIKSLESVLKIKTLIVKRKEGNPKLASVVKFTK
jgi:hypothetical protein